MFSENLAHFLRGPSPAVAQMRPGVVVVQKSATESLKVRHGPGVWRAGLAATPGTASTLSLCFWTRRSSRAAGADSGRHFHKPYWGDVETCVEYLWSLPEVRVSPRWKRWRTARSAEYGRAPAWVLARVARRAGTGGRLAGEGGIPRWGGGLFSWWEGKGL